MFKSNHSKEGWNLDQILNIIVEMDDDLMEQKSILCPWVEQFLMKLSCLFHRNWQVDP